MEAVPSGDNHVRSVDGIQEAGIEGVPAHGLPRAEAIEATENKIAKDKAEAGSTQLVPI